MINLALIIACGAIGVLFMISMVCELAQDRLYRNKTTSNEVL